MSRAGFYRYLARTAPEEEDVVLRERLQQLVLENRRRCGYRPLTALLRREGHVVNRKRVLRLMREDNLLCLRRQKYVLTTDSNHDLPIYPNLAGRMTLTGLNQLWVADITYIRLQREFVYLAVLLDAYSRRVIGWALERTLKAELPLAALRQALATRTWRKGELVHHSDRGTQYASKEYVALLEDEKHEIQVSMSRRGNPYDNARAERFMRTLKQEEVYGGDYRDLDDARARIGQFLDEVYNQRRLHSALQYVTPVEFEQAAETQEQAKAQAQAQAPVVTPDPRAETVETDGVEDARARDRPHPLEIPWGFPPFPPPDDGCHP